ncbi:MAG: M23 family metallopeptidase, partial [Actinomycetota bacterium]
QPSGPSGGSEPFAQPRSSEGTQLTNTTSRRLRKNPLSGAAEGCGRKKPGSGGAPTLWAAEAPPNVTEPPGMSGPQDTYGLERLLVNAGYGGSKIRAGFFALRGPLPVAGSAAWSNDWHAFRPCPEAHLHQGLDIFAARGTPAVSVFDAVVTGVKDGAVSGLAVSIRDARGTEYFYAHLERFAKGLHAGQRVHAGQVLGYVGDSGNAVGTRPHIHFEIHLRGLPTTPKPYVDRWLLTAQAKARKLALQPDAAAPAKPANHRDASAAAFGGGGETLAVERAVAAEPSTGAFRALVGIGGGLLVVLALLGSLRRRPRRKEEIVTVSPADAARTAALLELACLKPGGPGTEGSDDIDSTPARAPVSVATERGGAPVTLEITELIPFRPILEPVGRPLPAPLGEAAEDVPVPAGRGSAGLGLVVIGTVVTLVWSATRTR